MTQGLFSRRSLGLSGAIAVLVSGLAATSALASTTTPVDTSACSPHQLSRPFLSAKDANWYTAVPIVDAGWILSGGARITTTTQADGQSGPVLDLPSGAKAISPTICVDSTYPTARTLVRNVIGAEGVSFAVSYAGTKTWDIPQNTGQVHGDHSGWTLSSPINLHPGNRPGWQVVRFTFTAGGKTSDFQIYNFWVDPRMRA